MKIRERKRKSSIWRRFYSASLVVSQNYHLTVDSWLLGCLTVNPIETLVWRLCTTEPFLPFLKKYIYFQLCWQREMSRFKSQFIIKFCKKMVTTNLTVCFNTSSCWQKDGDIYINLVVIAAVFFLSERWTCHFPALQTGTNYLTASSQELNFNLKNVDYFFS